MSYRESAPRERKPYTAPVLFQFKPDWYGGPPWAWQYRAAWELHAEGLSWRRSRLAAFVAWWRL